MIWLFSFLGILICFFIVMVIITLKYTKYGLKIRIDVFKVTMNSLEVGRKIHFLIRRKTIFTVKKTGKDEYISLGLAESNNTKFNLEELLQYVLSLGNSKDIRYLPEMQD